MHVSFETGAPRILMRFNHLGKEVICNFLRKRESITNITEILNRSLSGIPVESITPKLLDNVSTGTHYIHL